ncbi:MAG: endonuclease/exonuclease/phosphatase family protein [Rikenellaceae bacterium]
MKQILLLLTVLSMATLSMAQTTVMSYNIRLNTNSDGQYRWDERKDRMITKLEIDGADIIGFQEALSSQVRYLSSHLKDYDWVGVGRDNGKRGGEYTPIFYKKDRFILSSWGTYWLSETPSVPSLGWDAACHRTATWALLESRTDGQPLLFINTHFDHVGVEARVNSSKAIAELADSLCEEFGVSRVLLVGDFNVPVYNSSLSPILESFDYALLSSSSYWVAAAEPSYIGFPHHNTKAMAIDHIFTRGLKAQTYVVDSHNYGLGSLSDHLSVKSTVVER